MFTEADYPNTKFPASSFVPPEGQIGAPIFAIGEAPGAHEDFGIEMPDGSRIYRPFIGPAGRMYDNLLRRSGIDRSTQVFTTNMIKRRPNSRNDMNTKEARIEVANNIMALRREINAVKPRVIVPMGNTALQALGIKWKIGQCRGFIFHTPYGKVIPTYHPSFLFQQFQEHYTVQKDWYKIARQMNTMSMPQFPEQFNLNPTIDDVERFVLLIINKLMSGQKVSLALDLETYYLDGSPLNNPIKLVGLAVNGSHALVIPFIDQHDNFYWKTEDEEIRAWNAIGNLLENPNLEVMTHNSLFDILVLMNHGFKVRCKLFDTMLAQFLIYHPSKHDLGYCASIYTDFPPWKLQMGHTDEEFRYYNAKDATVLHYMRPGLNADIVDNGLMVVASNLMRVIVPTCDMMLHGLSISQEAYNDVRFELENKLSEIVRDLRGFAGNVGFNPESPTQVADLLFNKLKLKSAVKTKSKKSLSTDDGVLNRLALRYPKNEAVKTIQKYRHTSQQYKTFIKNLYIHVDGRVHSSFKLHRVPTGRYASADPNLQNLPAKTDPDGYIRGLYKVKPGRILVEADHSQLELMIFGVMADDQIWLDAFRHGVDVHVINGKSLLQTFYDPKYRTFTKNFIYGLIYGSEGGEVERVAPQELIKVIQVPQMMANLKAEHPALFTYREDIETFLRANKFVTNAFGRRRYFPTMSLTKENLRQAYNHPIQGTAGDIMHTHTPLLVEQLDPETDWLVLQLHDAFYIETDENRVDKVAHILKDVMERPIETPMGYRFDILKAEIKYGTSLADKDLVKWN